MTKIEFSERLKQTLVGRGLPREEAAKSVEFYLEMIDDRVEDGMNEEDAVAALGSIEEIAEQILYDLPLGVLVKSKIKNKKEKNGNPALIILLAILGFPIWFPLMITVLAVIFSIYIIIWSLILAVFAVVAAVGVSGFVMLPTACFLFSENLIAAFGLLGAGLLLIGFAILLYFPAKYAAKGLIWLTGAILRGIKSLFIGKTSSKEDKAV